MPLSNEDNLRLNVLLAQPLRAIRINEGTMTVYALTDKGEAKVQLNPTARDDQYLRWVREMLSLKVTGSPGGYPIFLKRWTRMGHANNTLEHMLLLGEPEAIVALVHAPTLSHDIGVRAWWANPTTEVARRLLHYPEVVAGTLGKELSEYLLEFLPFEERQLDVVDTVRLCLQGDLIDDKTRKELWSRAKRKNPYYVGFLHAKNGIPAKTGATRDLDKLAARLQPLTTTGNPYALALLESQTQAGQQWLSALENALTKPVDQDVVISLFIAIDAHYDLPFPEHRGVRDLDTAIDRAANYCTLTQEPPGQLVQLIAALDIALLAKLDALLVLSQLGEDTLIPIFAGNDSVGSVMRRRLEPLTTPILERIETLMS